MIKAVENKEYPNKTINHNSLFVHKRNYGNTKLILTISDELDKYIKNKADNLGMSKLDYIRFVLMKEKEQDDSYNRFG
jgi:hypothetical protein